MKAILKENGGQGSAFNAGFEVAQGDIIAFLDADDYWYENKLETVVKYHQKYDGIQHNLLINNERKYTFLDHESTKTQSGLFKFGFMGTIPTSGLSFTQNALKAIFPMPEKDYRICADLYIRAMYVFYNNILSLDTPLAFYRVHESNNWYRDKSVNEDYLAITAKKLNEQNYITVPYKQANLTFAAYMFECTELDPNFTYIIYGTGFAGEYYFNQMENTYKIHCFASSFNDRETFYGFPVVDIMYLNNRVDDYDKIIIASQQMTEIVDYLLNNGVDISKIVYPKL